MYWVVLVVSGIGAFLLARYLVRPRVEAWRRGRALPARFVAVEIQSTGPSPVKHEVLAINAVRVTPGKADHPYFSALVRTTRPVPRKAADAARTSQQAIDAQGKPAPDVLRLFAEFVGSDRLVFYDAASQQAHLRALAERHEVAIDNPASDVRDMARRAWPARGGFKLRDLARTFGAEPAQRNHPLNDCGMIATVYVEAVLALKRFD